MWKNIEELNAINTKNLLLYYKAERNRFYSAFAHYRCDCGCGDFYWDMYPHYEWAESEYFKYKSYLNLIKSELNQRENIEKK